MHFAESCQHSPTMQPEGGSTKPKVMGESHLGDNKCARDSRTPARKCSLLERKGSGETSLIPLNADSIQVCLVCLSDPNKSLGLSSNASKLTGSLLL